jgi:hypothetical protein
LKDRERFQQCAEVLVEMI